MEHYQKNTESQVVNIKYQNPKITRHPDHQILGAEKTPAKTSEKLIDMPNPPDFMVIFIETMIIHQLRSVKKTY